MPTYWRQFDIQYLRLSGAVEKIQPSAGAKWGPEAESEPYALARKVPLSDVEYDMLVRRQATIREEGGRVYIVRSPPAFPEEKGG
jgi:hypothetical protein